MTLLFNRWLSRYLTNWMFDSVGSKLFLCVMLGVLVGLGGMSYFFYQELEERARDEIRRALSTQVESIDGQLTRVEESLVGMTSAALTMCRLGIGDAEAYKKLAFEFFLERPDLVVGNGFGQTPFQIVADREYYWPYFYVDQGMPGAVGQILPPPYEKVRYADLFLDDNYPHRNYYTIPVAAEEPVWTELYDWYGIVMTSYLRPFFDDSGNMIGVAGADVSVPDLTEQVYEPVTRGGGYFMILSEQGNLLAYPPEPEKGEARLSYQDIPLLSKVWERLQQADKGLIQSDGKFIAYQRIASTNWLMLAVLPQALILGPVLTITIGGAVCGGVVLALVVALFIKHLNKRLRPILEECSKVAGIEVQGEATPRQAMERMDELSILAHSFNRMTAQVNALIGSLEERVKERTAELAVAKERAGESPCGRIGKIGYICQE